ncbi:hypothetical protein P691DRAFT_856471 [Macrolepiota fuliginosa MF-IS2]|uniref:Uncharacterized protein n=1 Tax=Macrolepiota fuliginosa MF-IS2 TaxID=1400762 RepID=A0A9P5WY54_9AGAR|nr:hypothetical protein P691DRAFT_856471 [Macrolepiota fuliginosa MF-IS2]
MYIQRPHKTAHTPLGGPAMSTTVPLRVRQHYELPPLSSQDGPNLPMLFVTGFTRDRGLGVVIVYKGLRICTAHAALVLWYLGVHSTIKTAYDPQSTYRVTASASPGRIIKDNWTEFYDAYVNFFTDCILKQGIDKTLRTFVFSNRYNVGPEGMLSRFLTGLAHPMIHVGYGAELELPGIVSEATGATRKLARVAAHLGYISRPQTTFPENPSQYTVLQDTVADHNNLIRDYASQWTIGLRKPGELERKIEALIWTLTVMYGVTGLTYAQQVRRGQDGEFNADFILIHLVTSAAFVPSFLTRLHQSSHSQLLLLRSYFAVCLAWYIARAKPKVDICAFYESSSATDYPLPINPLPTPHEATLPGQDKPQSRVPDPWFPLVESTIVHPDEHLPKAIRALTAWASKFGTTPAGTFSGPQGKGTIKVELPGAEYLERCSSELLG